MSSMPPANGKFNFPNALGSKRRRMRSGGGVSTATNNTPKGGTSPLDKVTNPSEEQTTQTSRCKGATTIPIFLKKTYKMIDTCDPKIASWTPDGEMFVVKDPDLFAATIIPQYFDHNKFSSFARQLNFYGFRKMQAKPIRNADFNVDTAKHVTFYNEKFKRGRCDLLKEIQRSTRGGNSSSNSDQSKEISALKQQVASLEEQLKETNQNVEERMRRLELDMLGRMEQMMLAMQQQTSQNLTHQQSTASVNGLSNADLLRNASISSIGMQGAPMRPWDPLPLDREKSVNTNLQNMTNMVSQDSIKAADAQRQATMPAPATLPPHPKQKQMPPLSGPANGLPGNLSLPPSRLNSLRGISRGLSRGISGMSVDSSASAVLLKNSWEDKYFSMLMLGETEQAAAQAAQAQMVADVAAAQQPAAAPATDSQMAEAIKQQQAAMNGNGNGMQRSGSDGTLSSVSTGPTHQL